MILKLSLLNQKLQLIYTLQKKHQVATLEELIEVQSNLENSVLELGNIEEEIANLTLSIQEKTNALDELAVLIQQQDYCHSVIRAAL
jgi:DNA repair protein RecN (Recombination protein N)